VATYDLVSALPLTIDSVEADGLQLDVGRFVRKTTIVRLQGGGEEGVGEDVTYAAEDHEPFQRALPSLPLRGDWTLDSFSRHVGGLDLFPYQAPDQEAYRGYRRWAVESAALDLALRQAGTSLAEVVGREPRPVSFVCSMGLGDPPTLDGVHRRLAAQPAIRFKLDARSDWDDAIYEELVRLGCVDSVDFKGAYRGTVVDQPPDPVLYRRVAETFPDAWLEDPNLTPETDEVLRPHRDRITWDAPIHSVADIEGLPFAPRTVNVKPSRFGSVRALFEAYDHLKERGIGAYGGGQFELGAGRGQAQALASLFHPDGPNDIAPGVYNLPDPPPDLPASPLEPRLADRGFRWDGA
jgi:L-alanine-DL-glutamate epimerase-like enolase superfamily enzyme